MKNSVNNMSPAIEQQSVVRAERERLEREVETFNVNATQLREQLHNLEQSDTAHVRDVIAATDTLAHALEGGDQSAITEARKRLAGVSKPNGEAQARAAEIAALRAAIAAIDSKAKPIALRLMELVQQEKAITALRVQELATDLGAQYAGHMEAVAGDMAKGQALGILALRLQVPGHFAPPAYEMPSVIGPSVGNSGRLVLPLDMARQEAMAAIVDQLRAEGFAGV